MAKSPEMTFEQMMRRLETLVEAMEKGAMPLEESLKSFEEAATLSKSMEEMLKKGQARVMELSKSGSWTPLEQEDLQ